MRRFHTPVLCAILAAALYALSAPCAKLLLARFPPMIMAALLYLGAGMGMLGVNGIRRLSGLHGGGGFSPSDAPYVLGMIALDIAAPILLMFGLQMTSASNASLLNNFETVATSLIALLVFRERISLRLWLAIGLVTLGSMLLSLRDGGSPSFSPGSGLVLLACGCWGLENNFTRRLSGKDPLRIVVVKGLSCGGGTLLLAFLAGERLSGWRDVPVALLLGFVAYGLSIFFYVYAQRRLGAARTSAYYAVAPFLGVGFSIILLGEAPTRGFLAALMLMGLGVGMMIWDQRKAGNKSTVQSIAKDDAK